MSFFQSRSGIVITDERMSERIEAIVALHPDARDSSATSFEWNEMGMAELFGELYREEARYCPEFKSWYTYYDGYWQKDEGAILVSEKMKEFVRLMNLYCLEIEDEERQKSYRGFVNRLGDRRMRERILKDATGTLVITASEFDNHPYLVNCINGTYDLSDFTFREHRWDDFLTMRTNFSHTVQKGVRCERWEQFISEIMQGDEEKITYLQRALGYSLLGMANEECMFILHGKTTRNGKSTLLNTIETMLGDYAKVVPVGMICRDGKAKDVEAASPMLAGLKGKRFVTMAESNESGRLDEEKIKQLTGGEVISARALYQAAITYTPQFTLWLSCNDLPMVTDKSLFASDRIRVIEFNRHFAQDEQDKHLKEIFMTQEARSGIFMWLIRGYKGYLKDGLTMSEKMRSVVSAYERENDLVLQFLEERCERAKDAETTVVELHKAYKMWAKTRGLYIYSMTKFGNELERHPDWYQSMDIKGGTKTYDGIKLKTSLL